MYCMEQDIDIFFKKKRLFNLSIKHGVGCFGSNWGIDSELTKIISIKPSYFSTFIFSFRKKDNDSFFFHWFYLLKKTNGKCIR